MFQSLAIPYSDVTRKVGHIVELLDSLFLSPLPPDRVVARFFRDRKYLGSKDRAFISEVVYGVIRHYRKIGTLLQSAFSEEYISVAEHRHLLFTIVYQLMFSSYGNIEQYNEVWNSHSPSCSLNEFISYASGHTFIEEKNIPETEQLGKEYSFPDWMVERVTREMGNAETTLLLTSLNAASPIVLRVNTAKCSREDCRERFRAMGIETTLTEYSPYGLKASKRFSQDAPLLKEGFCEIQDEGSQLLAMLVNAKPGESVVDACAGAGGKSIAMAMMMKNRGKITAIDIVEKKLDVLQERAIRAGTKIISSHFADDVSSSKYNQTADAVLIDAPCSSVGRIRRDPMLKWRITAKQLEKQSNVQKSLLLQYSDWVKSGGRLIYATCSFFLQENEDVIEWFLEQRKDFTVMPVSDVLQELHLSIPRQERYLKLYPHIHGTDGFFGAVMKRI